MTPLRLLLVEDSASDTDLILHALREEGFDPDWHRVEREADFIESLDRGFDVILCDNRMPHFSGMRALELWRKRISTVPFILVSSAIGEDLAAAAMRKGAADCLLKDRLDRLGPAVREALERSRQRRKRHTAETAPRDSHRRRGSLACKGFRAGN
jgi:DNA-binding NtrC family response regulator